jgi:hypothetical protein
MVNNLMPGDVEKPVYCPVEAATYPRLPALPGSVPPFFTDIFQFLEVAFNFKIFYQHFMYLCRRIDEVRSAEGKPFQGIRGRSPVVALKKHKQQKTGQGML